MTWALFFMTVLIAANAKETVKRDAPHTLRSGNNETRLFITVLSSSNHDDLCKGIDNIKSQILEHTPGDIFVWSLNNSAESYVASNCALKCKRGVVFEALGEHWETPANAGDPSTWHWINFREDYRRMGHWRLTFPFQYGRSLGYRYLLQIDTDSEMQEVLEYNLVEVMANGQYDIGGRMTQKDSPTWGLPELTRFFLVAEQLRPVTLFDHCTPNNIDGLYTVTSDSFPNVKASNEAARIFEPEIRNGKGGWSQTVIYGNFVLYDLKFWFREDVQKYLALILSTGGHFRFRWNEQAVVSMIWQIFVPEDRFMLFSFKYRHNG